MTFLDSDSELLFEAVTEPLLNSSTIDELGEGAWKDGGASSTGAERVG